jgi:selenocysteine lyase/cysteine desulfurase
MSIKSDPRLAELAAYRAEFPIFQKKTYLNTCSLGALSQRVISGVNEFLGLWELYGASAWYELWLGECARVRGLIARLLNVSAGEIALAPSVGVALETVASSLDYGRRNKIVVCDMDFPTLQYQWLSRAKQDVEVVMLKSDDRISLPVERFAEVVDERTALVATTHVFFTSGYIQDIQRIAKIAHDKGAKVLIDGYQAAGQVPVDVKAAGVDFYISGGLKWLLGGPGIVFLYVREGLIQELEPQGTGWFAHRDQFAFDPEHFAYAPDARRFEIGTPAMAAVYALGRGLDIILEIGPQRLRQRNSYLVGDLVARLREAGFDLRIPARAEQHAGIVMAAMDDPKGMVHALAERDIIVDSRPGRVRLSPYFYNTEEDNRLVVEAMSEIARRQR